MDALQIVQDWEDHIPLTNKELRAIFDLQSFYAVQAESKMSPTNLTVEEEESVPEVCLEESFIRMSGVEGQELNSLNDMGHEQELKDWISKRDLMMDMLQSLESCIEKVSHVNESMSEWNHRSAPLKTELELVTGRLSALSRQLTEPAEASQS